VTVVVCCPALSAGECETSEADLVLVNQEHPDTSADSFELTYKVCIDVLSDAGIRSGDVLRLQRLCENEPPREISVCAVEFDLDGSTVLLLRQFVPPRQLISNSACVLPPLTLGPRARIVAAAPWSAFLHRKPVGAPSLGGPADGDRNKC
jgi:hypothetical protein